MRIDILMTTYNGEKYIREQLDSIVNQTYRKWNLIIRDDNSTDKTLKILNEYSKLDSRIMIIKDNKFNLGVTRNFEELLYYSTAEYIMFSDQDDIWKLDKIERFLNVILTNKIKNDILLIHSDSQIYSKNRLKGNFIGKRGNKIGIENFFFEYVVQGSSMMINKTLKNLALPFSDKVYIHDRYFHLLAELFGVRIYLQEPLINYRQHEFNQIGAKKNIYNLFYLKYYYKKDRVLIKYIFLKYNKYLTEKDKKKILLYLYITSIKTNRIKKIFLMKKNNINISLKKILFLLLKK